MYRIVGLNKEYREAMNIEDLKNLILDNEVELYMEYYLENVVTPKETEDWFYKRNTKSIISNLDIWLTLVKLDEIIESLIENEAYINYLSLDNGTLGMIEIVD